MQATVSPQAIAHRCINGVSAGIGQFGRSLDQQIDLLDFLTASEQRLLSQIQGRTYANMFGLVERFIAAKVLEVSREHWLGDQNALEALVRFGDEEINQASGAIPPH